jgi:hypothetical protein
MQSGCTTFCCFLCEWDSWAKNKHNKIKDCFIREDSVPGEVFVRYQPIVDKDKILLPLIYIKLELLENFIKAMNKCGHDFEYLREQFPKFSDAKLTLILLTWSIWWAHNNASKWQLGFNSAFKGLKEVFFIWRKFGKSIISLNSCWQKLRYLHG